MKGLYVHALMLLLALWGLVGCDETPTNGGGDDPPKERWSLYGLEGQIITDLRLFGDYLYANVRDAGLYRRNVRQDSSAWEYLNTANSTFLTDVFVDAGQSGFIMVSGIWQDQEDSTLHKVMVSNNDGASWAAADSGLAIVRGGQTSEAYIGVLEGVGGKIYASSNDGLFVTENAGESWDSLWVAKKLGSLSVGYFVVHPRHPQYMWMTVGVSDGYGFSPDVGFSTDGGRSWMGFSEQVNYLFEWLNDIDLHPLDTNVIYISNRYLYKTVDAGVSWEALTPSDSTGRLGAVESTTIDSSDPDHIFTSIYSYDMDTDSTFNFIGESQDGGLSWEMIDIPYESHHYWRLLYDPVGQSLYIVTSSDAPDLKKGILKYDASP